MHHDHFTYPSPKRLHWIIGIYLLGWVIAGSVAAQEPTAADVEKSSERLFQQAKEYFNSQNYWQAARDLIILLDFNAGFVRTDEVIFALGESMYEIGLQQGSGKLYKHLVTTYLRSPFQPKALLGLQRIEYDRRDYVRCIEYYEAMARSHPPQPVFDASRYYAGLSYYKVRDFPKAIELLSKVSSTSPFYEYSRYNLALACLRMKSVRKAVAILRDLRDLPVDNDATRTIVDESLCTLGYIYYELGFYRQAYDHFMSISPGHENYAAALLAAGWAAAGMNDYQLAINPLTSLVTLFPQKEQVEEGLFLLGRCYMKMKKFQQAISIFDQLLSLFPDRTEAPANLEEAKMGLVDESLVIEKTKTDLLVLETNLLDRLPLNEADAAVPEHLRSEREELISSRQNLLAQIQTERQSFEVLSAGMTGLQQLASRQPARQDWRAYAEYGKTRALFLQSFE
jgi:tetratricopeptide (TPR) repeat protein